MSKIRINELARELEVKPSRILELLPGLGVSDKKTHSSSLEDDAVAYIRTRLAGERGSAGHDHPEIPDSDEPGEFDPAPARANQPPPLPTAATKPIEPAPAARAVPVKEQVTPTTLIEAPQRGPAESAERPVSRPTAMEARGARPVELPSLPEMPKAPVEKPVPMRASIAPLRPPLSAGGGPIHPPLHSGPPAPPMPRRSIPVRSTPPPARPGQLLTGPRQPLPADVGDLSRPPLATPLLPRIPVVPSVQIPSASPGAPLRPAPTAPRPPLRPAGSPSAPGAPSAPALLNPRQQPISNRPLVGQPTARPVVPPRPDLVARLQKSAPPQPGPPRPGLPTRPPAPSRPGQPIYQGSVRPGQPLMRGPGGAQPGYPGGPSRPQGGGGMRPRTMHPTSGGGVRLEPASPVPAADPGRRHQTKPGQGRSTVRRRDVEEGNLRPLHRRDAVAEPPPINREITISEGITVKELSEKLGVKANLVIKRMFEKKIFATINQTLDTKMAEDIAREFGASTNNVSYEEESTQDITQTEIDQDQEVRAPVVTIMGHVDHGKTSLLDAIRSAHVADREAGGITQHIGAYQTMHNGKKIVFIDTPGHAAFTRMRSRGAKVTDIVILVVSADDGVMPQTLEAIDHAKAAKVPIIVAINKIDKPDAAPDRVKQQLADRGLLAEDWGGDVVMVPVSAKAKTNLDLLLEMILLVTEIQNLRANPARPGMGSVLEAKLDRGRGPVATVLVRNGTLRSGEFFICGNVFGKVRAMFDDKGESIKEAGPSTPVEVLGLDAMPEVGDTFQVVTDTAKAKQIVMFREQKTRETQIAKANRMRLESIHKQLAEGDTKELNIIVKADVGGTAEVLTDMLQKLSSEEIKIRVLHTGVGAITESDVLLASASEAIIIGFNTKAERNAAALADHEKVDIRMHSIIYNVTDEIKRAMSGLLDPVYKESYRGKAEVREVFRISKVGAVAGCLVVDGLIPRNAEVRVMRDGVAVHTGKIDALKRFKNDASEVKNGLECGISLVGFNAINQGDVIEAFVTERVAPEVFA